MALRLFDANPIPKTIMSYCQLDFLEQLQYNIYIFSWEDAFQIVASIIAAVV